MRCLICFEQILITGIHTLLFHPPICHRCFLKMNRTPKKIFIDGIPIQTFYPYEDFMISLVYQYKGCRDFALPPVFFAYDAFYLKIKYRDYWIVPVPSYKKSEEERGFSHVKEMYRFLNRPFLDCLQKKENFKQANLSKEKRKESVKNIQRCLDPPLQNKKILIVDDIITTGSTLQRCLHLMKDLKPKKIDIVAMAYTLSNS